MATFSGVFWGALVGLMTSSPIIGISIFVVGFMFIMMVGGMCIASAESEKMMEKERLRRENMKRMNQLAKGEWK